MLIIGEISFTLSFSIINVIDVYNVKCTIID